MTTLETPLDIEAKNLKKMHLYAHLRELRRRLVWVVLALTIGFGVGLGVAEPVYRFLLLPLQQALPPTATNTLIFTAVTDGFVTEMRVAWFVALV
ncbi:MAG: twin-arginine translocase subunit TatC, partial [Holosporales bacterium]